MVLYDYNKKKVEEMHADADSYMSMASKKLDRDEPHRAAVYAALAQAAATRAVAYQMAAGQ